MKNKTVEMKVILSIIVLNFVFMESDLLKSKHLTEKMINSTEELDKYHKTARKIFSKYERAKFYQVVAHTYYIKYQKLVEELESLDRHYYSLFSRYIKNFDYSLIEKKIKTPGVQNEFVPILFEDNTSINIRLFKTQAKMFKNQYHDYLVYFNNKVELCNDKLIELQKTKTNDTKKPKNYTKIYSDYRNFLLEKETVDINKEGTLNVEINSNNLISEISWFSYNNEYKREHYYLNNSENINKTIDFKDSKIISETNYDINLEKDIFFNFIISNEISDLSLINYGNYSITNYNDFSKPTKTTYYSINNDILGCIIKFFEQEHLSLISEIWYIGDCNKKIREFQISFDPETNKNKWIENRYR